MRIQTLGAMLVLVWAPNLAAQIWPGRSVRRAGAGIEALDSSAALPRRVFEDTGATVLMDPSVGPGGKWVALVRHIRIPTHDENGSDRRKTTVIVVDALTGRRQLEVPGGLYTFSGVVLIVSRCSTGTTARASKAVLPATLLTCSAPRMGSGPSRTKPPRANSSTPIGSPRILRS